LRPQGRPEAAVDLSARQREAAVDLSTRQREEAVLSSNPGIGGRPRVALLLAEGTIVQGPVTPGATPPSQKLVDATRLASEILKLEKDPMARILP
jgi:hypothetical protein